MLPLPLFGEQGLPEPRVHQAVGVTPRHLTCFSWCPPGDCIPSGLTHISPRSWCDPLGEGDQIEGTSPRAPAVSWMLWPRCGPQKVSGACQSAGGRVDCGHPWLAQRCLGSGLGGELGESMSEGVWVLRRGEPKCRTLEGAAVSTGCLQGVLRVSGLDTLQARCRCVKNFPLSYLFPVACWCW